MKLYRFIARYAGQRIILDVNGTSDDEAKNNFITKLREQDVLKAREELFNTEEDLDIAS